MFGLFPCLKPIIIYSFHCDFSFDPRVIIKSISQLLSIWVSLLIFMLFAFRLNSALFRECTLYDLDCVMFAKMCIVAQHTVSFGESACTQEESVSCSPGSAPSGVRPLSGVCQPCPGSALRPPDWLTYSVDSFWAGCAEVSSYDWRRVCFSSRFCLMHYEPYY